MQRGMAGVFTVLRRRRQLFFQHVAFLHLSLQGQIDFCQRFGSDLYLTFDKLAFFQRVFDTWRFFATDQFFLETGIDRRQIVGAFRNKVFDPLIFPQCMGQRSL